MSGETLLVISGPGIVPYSARGLTQSLDPIPAASQLRRTVNGDLADISLEQFRKYKSVITCNDTLPPAFDGLFPGQQLTVSCVAELSYKTAGGTPNRTVVADSSYTEGDYTFYRPQLTMRLVEFSQERDEYGRVVNWSMTLEES